MDLVVETINLTKRFEGKWALRNVSLQVPQGAIYGVVGANGAGKSTLLRLLLGIIWPTSGEVRLFGQLLPQEAAEVRQHVHYIGADGEVFKSFTVGDLVRYAAYMYRRFDSARCQRLLEALELSSRTLVRHLSMGMKMQLRLAIGLSTRPDLLLLDEPTTGLDAVVRKQFLQLLVDEVAHHGTTILMATHQLETLERIADGLALLYQGRLITQGLLDDFKQQIRSYQVIFESDAGELLMDRRVLSSEQRGTVWTLVVHDADGSFGKHLRAVTTHLEQVPLDLESLFVYLLKREGYARDTILLA